MARAGLSSIICHICRNPKLTRSFAKERNEGNSVIWEIRKLFEKENFSDISNRVLRIMKTDPRFDNPEVFSELLDQQSLLLQYSNWLGSQKNSEQNRHSCSVLFDVLVRAKDLNAAKDFLNSANFIPRESSLLIYFESLLKGGLVDEVMVTFRLLTSQRNCPPLKVWNRALYCLLKAGRTDGIWKLYGEMIELGVGVDVRTVGYLICAFCEEGKVCDAYQLLRQVTENGNMPPKFVFNKVIYAYYRENNCAMASSILHLMIEKNHLPDIYTYNTILKGHFHKGRYSQGFQLFYDLGKRGYNDILLYTTMIHGLCQKGLLVEAKKLWNEMVQKGLDPNEYTYNALIYGYFKLGRVKEAKRLYEEMVCKGRKETTLSCNMMIAGFCCQGKTIEAYLMFYGMPQKGIARDVITYNALITGLCRKGDVNPSLNLYEQLLAKGLQPTQETYTPLIRELCKVGDLQKAKELWHVMEAKGLQPAIISYNHFITGLCEQGNFIEGMEWLASMVKNKLRPCQEVFERVMSCLFDNDRLDDALLVLNSMYTFCYIPRQSVLCLLIDKICQGKSDNIPTCLEEILESI
ncbi:hypothetical protein QQ045_026389 [Rhodiola kirilowii]